MKISELRAKLTGLEEKYGNVDVKVCSHHFDAKGYDGGYRWGGIAVESTGTKCTAVVLFASKQPYQRSRKEKFSNRSLRDLLSLVGVDVDHNAISRWTVEQMCEANKWATKSYLKASDNNVRVPKRPKFLPEPR